MLRELYRPLVEQKFRPPPFLPRPADLERVPAGHDHAHQRGDDQVRRQRVPRDEDRFRQRDGEYLRTGGRGATGSDDGHRARFAHRHAFLNAGIGWGGSCFGKDIIRCCTRRREYGYQARLLEASLAVNRLQRQLVIQKLQEKLFILKGRTIALLGLAFKPNTDDLRDAPSLQIAERLLQMGARVRAYDPIAMPLPRAASELRIATATTRCRPPNMRTRWCW